MSSFFWCNVKCRFYFPCNMKKPFSFPYMTRDQYPLVIQISRLLLRLTRLKKITVFVYRSTTLRKDFSLLVSPVNCGERDVFRGRKTPANAVSARETSVFRRSPRILKFGTGLKTSRKPWIFNLVNIRKFSKMPGFTVLLHRRFLKGKMSAHFFCPRRRGRGTG